jgi:arsenite/tail-anchored protein-transporting ATPase
MRVIVHTGKGGVGKTSVSAATALHCAEMGLKTIVISTDTAHSLGDSLDKQIGPEPIEIYPNLWAQEVDARYSMDKYWGRVQKYMVALFSRKGVEDVVAEEVTILPGFEEGAHLLWINQYFEKGEFDVLIVDAAPTAETLRLLSLPDVTKWWFERVLTLTQGVSRVIRPLSKLMRRGDSVPDDDAWDQVRELFDTLDKVRLLLSDPEVSSMRLVVNPEKMVIKETQRTYTYLNLYGYATDAILVNRVIPDEVSDPYFNSRKVRQAENITFIGEAFGQLPMLKAPMFSDEVGGLEALRRLGKSLYGDQNPAERMFHGTTHKIESLGDSGEYLLKVPLGFADKDDMDLYRSRDEITLRVGPYRRNIVLPYTLHDLEIADAKFSDSSLHIRFYKPETVNGKAKK